MSLTASAANRPGRHAMIRHLAFICCVGISQLTAGGCSDRATTEARAADSEAWPKGHSIIGAANFRALMDNIEVAGITFAWLTNETGEEIALIAEIDATKLDPTLIAAPGTGISVSEAMARPDRLIIIGSGFVSEANSYKPVGLLKVDGSELNPLEPYGYTRIIGFNENGFSVLHRKNYAPEFFNSALQAGPGIVEQSLLDISERDLQRPSYYRSFVALCADRVRFGVSTVPTHLHTLGQALVQFSASRRLDCPEVVNFAGDTQAVMAVRDGSGLIYHGDIDSKKVSLLSFSARQ